MMENNFRSGIRSCGKYGYVVPDPLDPDVVFGGKITRLRRRTNQVQNILRSPFARGLPCPPDLAHRLFAGWKTNVLRLEYFMEDWQWRTELEQVSPESHA